MSCYLFPCVPVTKYKAAYLNGFFLNSSYENVPSLIKWILIFRCLLLYIFNQILLFFEFFFFFLILFQFGIMTQLQHSVVVFGDSQVANRSALVCLFRLLLQLIWFCFLSFFWGSTFFLLLFFLYSVFSETLPVTEVKINL